MDTQINEHTSVCIAQGLIKRKSAFFRGIKLILKLFFFPEH